MVIHDNEYHAILEGALNEEILKRNYSQREGRGRIHIWISKIEKLEVEEAPKLVANRLIKGKF